MRNKSRKAAREARSILANGGNPKLIDEQALFTGTHKFEVTLLESVPEEKAMIDLLNKLPRGRRSEFIRQRLLGGNSGGPQVTTPVASSFLPQAAAKKGIDPRRILEEADSGI